MFESGRECAVFTVESGSTEKMEEEDEIRAVFDSEGDGEVDALSEGDMEMLMMKLGDMSLDIDEIEERLSISVSMTEEEQRSFGYPDVPIGTDEEECVEEEEEEEEEEEDGVEESQSLLEVIENMTIEEEDEASALDQPLIEGDECEDVGSQELMDGQVDYVFRDLESGNGLYGENVREIFEDVDEDFSIACLFDERDERAENIDDASWCDALLSADVGGDIADEEQVLDPFFLGLVGDDTDSIELLTYLECML